MDKLTSIYNIKHPIKYYSRIPTNSIFEVDKVIINFNIINLCNAKCSFCYARDEFSFDSLASMKDIYKMCIYLSRINFPFNILLIGGEPTLHPKLKNIIQLLRKITKVEKILIASNNIKLPDDEVINMLDGGLISFHPHLFNTEEKVKLYKKNILKYKKIAKNIQVDIVFNPKYLKEIYELMLWLKENNIFFYCDNGFNFKTLKLFKHNVIDGDLFKNFLKIQPKVIKVIDNEDNEFILNEFESIINNCRNNKNYECCALGFDIFFREPDKIISMCCSSAFDSKNGVITPEELNKKYHTDNLKTICNLEQCYVQAGGVSFKKLI